MARWLVTQGDRQFSARDLGELKQLATEGRVGPGDMVQPPGASDWLYASELPELKGLLQAGQVIEEDDFDVPRKKGLPLALLALIFLGVMGVGGYYVVHFTVAIKDSNLALLGEDGITYTEMVVTADPATLYSEPDANSTTLGTVKKNEKAGLQAKRGDWYKITSEAGGSGWVQIRDVTPPGYVFAGPEVREEYDPLYNPDRYVFVKNSNWMQLPDQKDDNVTIFQFLLQNKSRYEMVDMVLLATIRDKNDQVLETKEIAIEGGIAPYSGTMVGTLQPADGSSESARGMTEYRFNALSKSDADLHLRWTGGVEVGMESTGFVEANIDLLQVRAVPNDDG